MDHQKLSYLFQGQGPLYKGMGNDVSERPIGQELYERANVVLQEFFNDSDYNLRTLSVGQLSKTENTQPAVFVNSAAFLDDFVDGYISRTGGMPNVVNSTGHSLGLYSALYASGMLSFEDTVGLLARRGQAMSKVNGILLITYLTKADRSVADSIAKETGTYITHCNNPLQIIMGGEIENVKKAKEKVAAVLKEKEVDKDPSFIRPQVPFHTPLMEPAAEEFSPYLKQQKVEHPHFPVFSDTTGVIITPENVVDILTQQIYSPVEFDHVTKGMMYDTNKTTGKSFFVDFGGAKPGTKFPGRKGLIKSMVVPTYRDLRNSDHGFKRLDKGIEFREVVQIDHLNNLLAELTEGHTAEQTWIGEMGYTLFIRPQDPSNPGKEADGFTYRIMKFIEDNGLQDHMNIIRTPRPLYHLRSLSPDAPKLPFLQVAVGCETASVYGINNIQEIFDELEGIAKRVEITS